MRIYLFDQFEQLSLINTNLFIRKFKLLIQAIESDEYKLNYLINFEQTSPINAIYLFKNLSSRVWLVKNNLVDQFE